MEHKYMEDLIFFKGLAVENIIGTANWDIENYFDLKDEAEDDEDIYFDEDKYCEEYGRGYKFDEDEVEDAISFLFSYEDCLPDDTDKAIDDYREYNNKIADAEYKIRHIEKKINMLIKDFNLEGYRIETSCKSVSTYLYIPNTSKNMEMIINETDDYSYYEDLDEEDIEDLDELCIRFSDHDTGSYWDDEYGDVSYDDSYAMIEIR